MIEAKDDGVSHINIYSKGQTELGRFLSNFSDCYVNIDGQVFRTIEGYWYWLGCKDNRLLKTNGWESKKLGRELQVPDWNKDPEFERKIGYAITLKIISNEWCKQELIKSKDLPLYHYYTYGTKIMMVKDGLWIINLIAHIRQELIDGVIQ